MRYFFSPGSVFLIVILIIAAVILLPFIFLGIIGSALGKLGFGLFEVILLVAAMLIGSCINIPVTTVKSNPEFVRVEHGKLMSSLYKVPEFANETTIAVNLGGCVIPLLVSAFLFIKGFEYGDGSYGFPLILRCLIGIAVVSAVVWKLAKPVPGTGIVVSFLIPPLCALICGLVLSGGISVLAPVIAYVSATLGTLIGADIMNLRKLGESGASVASIGGAGTFDGIFLSGIIAAFLA